MNILAIEISSRQGSVALSRGGKVVAEKTWSETLGSGQNLFTILPGLAQHAGLGLVDIDVFAVGRGPGAYSGLRTSLAAAQAAALPGKKQVYTVNSGEVLACEAMRDSDVPAIAIVGDARRERVWFRVFRCSGDRLIPEGDYALAALGELEEQLPADVLIASPDWSRLAEAIGEQGSPRRPWIEEDCYPSARALGMLVEERLKKNLPSEPLTPIYMHPPVFVEPRFGG